MLNENIMSIIDIKEHKVLKLLTTILHIYEISNISRLQNKIWPFSMEVLNTADKKHHKMTTDVKRKLLVDFVHFYYLCDAL